MKRLGKWLAARKAIEIVEEGGVRVLQIGGNAIQSAMRLAAPDRIELDYVRAMMVFLLFRPGPREVLMVGLGGGSMARFIHQRMPQTRVTVVEINPGVVTAARRYFHFPEEDARLEIVVGDGAEVVPQRPASCDVLVVDGFVNGSPAKDLCTRSFYDSAFAALRPGGVMVANFMSDDKRIETYCGRIEESFGRNPTLLLAVWVAGGAFSVIGALCYAELATAFPSAGGEYHFIGRAYGRPLAFLYGWARMTVVVAGSIAVFAYLFGDYMSRVIHLGPQSSAIWAAGVVVVLTGVNYAGIREGKLTQNFFTFLECGGLVLIIVAGFALAPDPAPAAPPAGGGAPWYMGAEIGSAMVFVLFTYGGWNDAAYISAEVRDRRRNMVRALLLSIGIVTLLYLLVNLAYLKGLGYEGMTRSDAVAADLMKRVWGPAGEKLISVMIAIAALTSVNGSMIVGARSNYALGRDWPLLGFLGRWDEASGSPRTAMLVQGAIALALVVFGAFQNAGFKGLVEYSLPVFWGFFMLTGVALFVLRVKERGAPRPFRVPGYPVVPGIFVLTCAYLLYSSLAYHRTHALVGLGVLAVGAAVMLFANRGQITVSGLKKP